MIAAKRELSLKTKHGIVPIPVEIAVPAYESGSWNCDFSIGWPEGSSAGQANGSDAVQALYFAMQKVAALLYSSDHHKAGELYFYQPGYGYGFPLPHGGRSVAVGADAKL